MRRQRMEFCPHSPEKGVAAPWVGQACNKITLPSRPEEPILDRVHETTAAINTVALTVVRVVNEVLTKVLLFPLEKWRSRSDSLPAGQPGVGFR